MQRWLVVLLLFTGCGFGITGPDPDRPHGKMPVCDTGKGAVVLDGAMAVVSGVVALSLVGENEPAIAVLPLAIGALYLGGALRGNSNANKCRKALGELESYLVARETLPAEDRPVAPVRRPVAEERDAYAPPVAAASSSVPPAPPRGAPVTPAPPLPAPVTPSSPLPAPGAGAPKPPPARSPPAKPQPSEDAGDPNDWSAFWREVD